eukprot:3938645-Amphidinium_carterae.1
MPIGAFAVVRKGQRSFTEKALRARTAGAAEEVSIVADGDVVSHHANGVSGNSVVHHVQDRLGLDLSGHHWSRIPVH